MARIGGKRDGEYPLAVRALFASQLRKYGKVMEPLRLWGRSPKLLFAFLLLGRAFERKGSPLEPALRSLVCVRVSQINSCPFCVDLNSAVARKRKVSREKLLELESFKASRLYEPREQAALTYAEAMTEDRVTDSHIENLRSHFSEDEIVELTALIAYQNMSSKFNAALGVPAPGIGQF